ncbi:VOC family protein [Actinomycetospora cinnamomea]|uniref:Catechol 2,3-dioxygenase-like lactoylglutathione lyase family enzyme n=1 Tax=Actinomycetospora cinnamomea TaxID=663609 RepID=A0A2U1FLT9_9PSEU|nr:VOC family protein [Actinomycetospora cinnamomea]PVZ13173.1 catechol 2,3-dioxygenase-like lactoylglutathione lyase family enzyme [Actinomycetospora cinnamomea]
MPPRLTVVELVVSDMAASLAFYRRLGLDAPPGADQQPHVEIDLGGGMRLALDTEDTVRSFDPHWTPPQGGPRNALAFACDSPAEVDDVYASLVNAGYQGELGPWDAAWGMRYAVVHDPDGSQVDLFAPLPQ